MASDIRVIHVQEFLKAAVQGDEFDFEASKQALLEIADAAPASPQIDIMIDVREAPTHMTLAQLSLLAVEFNRLRIGAGRKVAVLTAEERFDNAHFFAISARGMGGNVQAFTSFEEAFNWLTL